MKKKLVSICALLMALAMIFSLAACDSFTQEEETTEPPIISKTPQPSGNAAVLAYFNGLINGIKAAKPGVRAEQTDKNVSDVVCGEEGAQRNELLEAAVPTLKRYILTRADTVETEYGESLTDIFPIKGQDWSSRLSEQDIVSAECVENDKNYEITIILKDEPSPADFTSSNGKAFDLIPQEEMQAAVIEFREKMKDYIAVGDIESVTYVGCQIFCVVERETDNIVFVEYRKNVRITTTLTGVGTLEQIGVLPCAFTYNCADRYSFNWVDPATTTEAAE